MNMIGFLVEVDDMKSTQNTTANPLKILNPEDSKYLLFFCDFIK